MRVSPLAYQVHTMLQRQQLVRPGARIVVGVSGGPDSVALLALLAELRARDRLTLWGVYVNHGWRPRAAQRAAAVVRAVGRRLGVPIVTVAVPPGKRPRRSWEGTARHDRYAALARIARRVRAGAVAVGHTQEDQAETVLLAMIRGSGLRGAAGMPAARPLNGAARSPVLIRPLLAFRHEALRAYLRSRTLPWVTDPTNAETRFRRNAMRRTVLPAIVRMSGAQAVDRLTSFAELARADDAWLDQQVTRWCRRHARLGRGHVRLPRSPLARLPVAGQRRVIRWAADQAGSPGVAFRQVEAVLACLPRGAGEVSWPHGGRVAVTGRSVVVTRRRGSLAPVGDQ